MNKLYFILLCALGFTFKTFSQEPVLSSELYPELRYNALKGEVFYSAYRQVKGNAYLTDDWTVGTIKLISGEQLKAVQYKFDIYVHRLLVYQDYLKRVVIPDKSEIESFTFNDNGRIRTFKKVDAQLTNQKYLSQYFLEVLSEGSVSFYKLYLCNVLPMKTPEMPYIDEFLLQQNYFLFYNNQYQSTKIKKSVLINEFPNYKAELKKYIRENKLKMKRENDYAIAIGHLNNLMNASK
jgi:hypothetical protein